MTQEAAMTDEERADRLLENVLEDDYVKALLTGRVRLMKKLIERALRAARQDERAACIKAAQSADLPEGYQWGVEARSNFDFGKERAIAAIEARGGG